MVLIGHVAVNESGSDRVLVLWELCLHVQVANLPKTVAPLVSVAIDSKDDICPLTSSDAT